MTDYEKRIAKIREDNKTWEVPYASDVDWLLEQFAEKDARIAELEKALRKFVDTDLNQKFELTELKMSVRKSLGET